MDVRVPVLDGRRLRYTNLDNAATTPPLRSVVDAVATCCRCTPACTGAPATSPGSPPPPTSGRGTRAGVRGRRPRTRRGGVRPAHDRRGRQPGGPVADDATGLGRAHDDARAPLQRPAVAGSDPGRPRGRALSDGTLDEDDLDRLPARHAGRIAVAGRHRRLERHRGRAADPRPGRAGARGRRAHPGRRRPAGRPPPDRHGRPRRPRQLDFVALSPHKMYAPFGTGALDRPARRVRQPARTIPAADGAGRHRRRRAVGRPARPRGGRHAPTSSVPSPSPPPWRGVAEVGLDRIAAHEQQLTADALSRARAVPGLTPSRPARGVAAAQGGRVPFTLDGIDSGIVAAALGYEHGIGVRSGCFCAQPYIAHLLGLRPADMLSAGADGGVAGMVRISFGAYSDSNDVDRVRRMRWRRWRPARSTGPTCEAATGPGCRAATGRRWPTRRTRSHSIGWCRGGSPRRATVPTSRLNSGGTFVGMAAILPAGSRPARDVDQTCRRPHHRCAYPIYEHDTVTKVLVSGALDRTRTCGLPLRRRSLYPPELRGRVEHGTPGAGAPPPAGSPRRGCDLWRRPWSDAAACDQAPGDERPG